MNEGSDIKRLKNDIESYLPILVKILQIHENFEENECWVEK